MRMPTLCTQHMAPSLSLLYQVSKAERSKMATPPPLSKQL